ncbi:MAG TPA: peptidase dimerization domain-containing protein [Actinopolymorphaceae bacterium]
MTDTETMKERARRRIEAHAEEIVSLSEDVMRRPELGFAETGTAALVADRLRALGLTCRTGLALTGVRADLVGRSSRPRIALLGELDALVVPDHPLADPDTGAAPACGHHAQLAAVLGAAIGLGPEMANLDGSVALLAVPAEELVEVDRRLELRARGELEFLTGKAELIRLGEFDDIDLAVLVHTGSGNGPRFSIGDTLNGSLIVRARFLGRSVHAGGRPWAGINALEAANLAIAAINAQRATFPDDDGIRVTPVLTASDGAPGVVPGAASLEVLVRARHLEALTATEAKVRRALRAGALALGARLETGTLVAYLPLTSDRGLDAVVEANAREVLGSGDLVRGRHLGASTDMGDLSAIAPVSHPYTSGTEGDTHSAAFRVVDHHAAAVEPAMYLAGAVIDLLADGATAARRILDRARPGKLTPAEYVAMRRGLSNQETWSPKDGSGDVER